MQIVIALTFEYDIIEIPINNPKLFKSLIKKFDKYIHDKNNDHLYWVYQGKKKVATEVNTDSLVWWLNNIYQNDKNFSVIISRDNDLSKLDKENNSNIIYL